MGALLNISSTSSSVNLRESEKLEALNFDSLTDFI
jgi:hypothetical protein